MTALLRLLGLDSVTAVNAVEAWHWQSAFTPPANLVAAVAAIGLLLAMMNWLPRLAMRFRVRAATFVLRLGMVGVLLLALYQMELSVRLRVHKPQRWHVVVDDSGSMQTADEAGSPRFETALADLQTITDGIGGDVSLSVKTLSGEPLGNRAGTGPTHLYATIMEHALRGEPIDRLVVLTDGRDVAEHDFERLGSELRSGGVKVAVRTYGETEHGSSAAIFAEPESEVIRLGEELIVRGSILVQVPDASYSVRLLENGEEVLSATIPRDRREAFNLNYRPKDPGLNHYVLELSNDALEGESHQASFMAQIVPEKIKILLIEGFPRFEFKFIRYVLDIDPMVDLVSVTHLPGGGVFVQGEPLHDNPQQGLINSRADLFQYDVVVLRDLPRTLFRAGGDMTESRMRLLRAFVEERGGGLIMGGGRDVYRAGGYGDSHLAAVMPFDLSEVYGDTAQFPGQFLVNVHQGLYDHPILRLLPDSTANRERWRMLRELDGCNNVGRPRPLATTLLSRRIEERNAAGDVIEKQVPVMVYQPFGEGKVIAASVDTFWRWQLQPDFDDPPLQTLLANMVRYVAPPPSKAGQPRIRMKDRTPQVGSEAVLYTLLRDEQYRPIRNADLVVTVTGPGERIERIFPRDLPEHPGYYEYRVPLNRSGVYHVAAEYGSGRDETRFVAGAMRGEYADLRAAPEAMEALLSGAEGEQIDSMQGWVAQSQRQPATLVSRRTLPVWNSPLSLILFIGMVALDCYLRKRHGLA